MRDWSFTRSPWLTFAVLALPVLLGGFIAWGQAETHERRQQHAALQHAGAPPAR